MRIQALAPLVRERVVLAMIVVNLVILFIRALPDASDADQVLMALDHMCLLYFIAEMLIKIRLQGWQTFWASTLNRFDLILVVASLPSLVTVFAEFDEFALLLVFRAARLLRFLRVLRFIPHAQQLWRGIGRAVRASVGLLIALILYNGVLALIGCHLFREVSPQHFGDPFVASYTIFKVFTIEGWFDIPQEIATKGLAVGLAAKLFFSFVVVTGGFMGIGIANAVFVDEMVLDNNEPLEAAIAELRDELQVVRQENQALLEALVTRLDGLTPEGVADSRRRCNR